jgi:hypothetical protein
VFAEGKEPQPTDLLNVGVAQQPKRHGKPKKIAAYKTWSDKVNKGVSQIITGRRVIPQTAQLDLCDCLNLIEAAHELPFDWDISLYTEPPASRPARLATARMGSLLGDKTHRQYTEPGEDDDLDDLDDIKRPAWNLGEARIISMQEPPFWALVR